MEDFKLYGQKQEWVQQKIYLIRRIAFLNRVSGPIAIHPDGVFGNWNCIFTRSQGALRAPTSSWRPFGPLDFVLRALRALRPVRRARLRSGPVKKGHFLKIGIVL